MFSCGAGGLKGFFGGRLGSKSDGAAVFRAISFAYSNIPSMSSLSAEKSQKIFHVKCKKFQNKA